MSTINIANLIAPSFDELFFEIQEHKYTHYWTEGGRGSTKSSLHSINIPLLLIQNPQCHAVVLRKVGNTIKNSVYPQIQWGIEQLDLTNQFHFKISPPEITYLKTGQKILFFGVDDPQKIKSIKVPFGHIGIVWYEELDQYSGMEEIRNLNQSILRGGEKYWCFYSFNPPKSQDSWVNSEKLIDESDRVVHHSTYLDVPKEWLGEQFFYEAEKLKQKNEMAYRHEYLGEVTGTGGTVFENVSHLDMSNEMIEQFDRLYRGCDFGFTIDPTAFVNTYYDANHEDLYIFDEIYQQKLSNKRTAELILSKCGNGRVLGDSASPGTIYELANLGVNIVSVKKWPDSVDFGIKWLQNLRHIYIDRHRCPNTYKEFVRYEYERNKEGKFISAYPDKNNHAIDATRYALNDIMRNLRTQVGHINIY
ncbi:PBSX family phage terminase large subunit [uncultured Veillonella sp.]|uniref:PBSX family phage terminase large subunit n=1 Tax=uncultured Veillonella sp. TaxID=159268 RepID=UPI0025EA14A8|nr:PBSX family phage terminase large subunit [uncultured Veillonella sp.]